MYAEEEMCTHRTRHHWPFNLFTRVLSSLFYARNNAQYLIKCSVDARHLCLFLHKTSSWFLRKRYGSNHFQGSFFPPPSKEEFNSDLPAPKVACLLFI